MSCLISWFDNIISNWKVIDLHPSGCWKLKKREKYQRRARNILWALTWETERFKIQCDNSPLIITPCWVFLRAPWFPIDWSHLTKGRFISDHKSGAAEPKKLFHGSLTEAAPTKPQWASREWDIANPIGKKLGRDRLCKRLNCWMKPGAGLACRPHWCWGCERVARVPGNHLGPRTVPSRVSYRQLL